MQPGISKLNNLEKNRNPELLECLERNRKVKATEIIFKFYFYERILDRIGRLRKSGNLDKYIEGDNYFKIKNKLDKLSEIEEKAKRNIYEIWKFIKVYLLAAIIYDVVISKEIMAFKEEQFKLGNQYPLEMAYLLRNKSSKEIVSLLEWFAKIFVGPSFPNDKDKRGGYGGEKWKKITDFAIEIWKSKEVRTDLIDGFFDLQHNTGNILDGFNNEMKTLEYSITIKDMLDLKFASQDLEQLILGVEGKNSNLTGSDWNSGPDELNIPYVSQEVLEEAKSELSLITEIELGFLSTGTLVEVK